MNTSTTSTAVIGEKQVAIVTGAARGIGAAIALRLGRDGYAVVVNYAGSADEAATVVNAICEAGGQAVAVKADVSDPAAVRHLFDAAVAQYGGVDVLVNNAGIMPPALPTLADTDDKTFDALMAVNVKGSFNTMREAATRLRRGGRIVNFSTSVVGLAMPGYAVYAATKAAVEAMTHVLTKELRGRNITVNAICEAGGQAVAVKADVSDPAAVRRLFDAAVAQYGAVDVLVNNAGIMPPALPMLADTDDKTFDALFAVNVKGSFNTMREAAARLRQGGRIVNFSSSVIGLAMPGYAVYAATKSAIETMTNILAKELRGRNITVNAVAPGPTATALFLNGKPQDAIDRLAKAAPLERLGQPEDIANAVSMLVGANGGWINGQTIRANGGLV